MRRFNLGQEPLAFAENEHVREILTTTGESALPIVFTDGSLRSVGRFPTREELAQWTSTPIATHAEGSPLDTDGVVTSCCSSNDEGTADGVACCATSESVVMGRKTGTTTSCC